MFIFPIYATRPQLLLLFLLLLFYFLAPIGYQGSWAVDVASQSDYWAKWAWTKRPRHIEGPHIPDAKSGDRGPKSTKEQAIGPTVAPFHPKMERGNGCEAGGPMGPRATGGLGCGLGTHQGARARQEGCGIEGAFPLR